MIRFLCMPFHSLSLGRYLGLESQDWMITLYVAFLKNRQSAFWSSCQARTLPFLHSLCNTCYCLSDHSHPGGCKIECHCWFVFLWWLTMPRSFVGSLAVHLPSLEKNPCAFGKWALFVQRQFLGSTWMLGLGQFVICVHFSPFCELSFLFLMVSFGGH